MSKLSKKIPYIVTLTALWLLPTTSLWAEPVEFDGLIEPYEVVNIGAPTVGIVSRVTVDRGSLVEKGQVLVELESSLERATLEKAKAMATFDGEIGMSQTQLAFANRVHERVKPLAAISTHDKDQAATEILLTQYRLEKARENLTLAKLELRRTEAALALRSIKSPIPGVVVERYVSPGEYANSQPLLRVAQVDPLRVEVILPAQMFGKIKPGMTATIVPEIAEYGEHTAKVTIVDKVIDSASSTFGVRLEMPNAKQKMPSGLKCVVRFDIADIPGGVKTTANRIPSGR
jgi:RND family efflux transporter MFP subunit